MFSLSGFLSEVHSGKEKVFLITQSADFVLTTWQWLAFRDLRTQHISCPNDTATNITTLVADCCVHDSQSWQFCQRYAPFLAPVVLNLIGKDYCISFRISFLMI